MARKQSTRRKERIPAEAAIKRRLANIRLLSLDVDGVLTDGGLYYGDDGTVARKFNVRDGVGIKRVLALGVEVAFVSAGTTQSIHHRARTLGVRHVIAGVADKRAEVGKLCRRLGMTLAAVAHVGDDLNDVPLMKAAGLALTVPGAVPEALAAAQHVTRRPGGDGAVREICDLIASARLDSR
jgi:3-deoxy-D-manno-octulosonate 8-phosphate phosphatase (KDO 8-P phosphatase)